MSPLLYGSAIPGDQGTSCSGWHGTLLKHRPLSATQCCSSGPSSSSKCKDALLQTEHKVAVTAKPGKHNELVDGEGEGESSGNKNSAKLTKYLLNRF